MPWQFTAALLARELVLLVCLAVLRRARVRAAAGALPRQDRHVHLLAAFPVLLLAHAVPAIAAGGRPRSAGPWPGGASVLYWLAGVLYVGADRRPASARPEVRHDATRDADRRAPDDQAPDAARGSSGGRWMSPDFLTELFRNPLDPGYADAAARKAASAPTRAGGGATARGHRAWRSRC